LNHELAVIEEKPGKRSKNIRKWKAGQMPETNTPVRAGTDIKTPSRPRIDEKKIRETVKETVDVVVMDIEEQVKDLKAAVSELEDKLYECQDDQQAFRRQQLWSLKSQIGDQRAAAAKEECFVGQTRDLSLCFGACKLQDLVQRCAKYHILQNRQNYPACPSCISNKVG
jgi:TolA-binding protein